MSEKLVVRDDEIINRVIYLSITQGYSVQEVENLISNEFKINISAKEINKILNENPDLVSEHTEKLNTNAQRIINSAYSKNLGKLDKMSEKLSERITETLDEEDFVVNSRVIDSYIKLNKYLGDQKQYMADFIPKTVFDAFKEAVRDGIQNAQVFETRDINIIKNSIEKEILRLALNKKQKRMISLK